MKYLKVILTSLAAILLGVGWHAQQQVQAASTGAEFTIQPVLPEAQTNQKLTYFSLDAEAGATYPLTVKVTNLNSSQEQAFQAELVAATETSAGKINYTPSKSARDASALKTLPELALDQPTTEKFTVPAGGTQEVTFTVTMPKNNIRGTVLGSIYVRRLDPGSDSKAKIGLSNEFAMTVPVMLQQKNGPRIMPKLALTKVKQIASGGATVLVADVHNSQPVMFGGIDLHTKLYKKGARKPLLTQTDHKFEMAPNATLAYQIPTDGKSLSPGSYLLKMRLTSGKKTFNIEKEFVIHGSDKRATEQQLVAVNRTSTWKWWLLGGIIILGILALILLIIKQRQRK